MLLVLLMNKNHIAIFFYNSLILKKKLKKKVREKGCKKCATAKRVDKRWRIFPFKHNGAESTGVTASHVANAADSTADS